MEVLVTLGGLEFATAESRGKLHARVFTVLLFRILTSLPNGPGASPSNRSPSILTDGGEAKNRGEMQDHSERDLWQESRSRK